MGPAVSPTTRATRRWLWRQARHPARWIGLSVGLGLAGGLLLILQAGLYARIVHGAVMEGSSREALAPFFLAAAGLVVARAFVGWGREMAGFRAGEAVRGKVRTALMDHMARLGPSWLAGQETGALAGTVMERVEALHDFFSRYLPQVALAVMLPAAILAFVFPLSWAAGGLLLLTAPMIPLFMALVGMGAESVSQRHYVALSRMGAHFLNVLRGLPTLRLFDRSRETAESVARVSADYRKTTMQVLRIAFLSSAVLEFFSSIAIALVAVYLGMTYLGYYDFGSWGRPMTLRGGLFILLLAPEFYLPLRELGAHFHARAEAVGAAAGILEILAAPAPETRGVPGRRVADGAVRLSFRGLHFTYEGRERAALHGVDLEIGAAETVAVVGESGAGKSTLVHLATGFLQPLKGEILVNGAPLRELPPERWRAKLAWMGQDAAIFHGTIRDNIRLGRPDAGDAAVAAAAAAAGVTAFTARLPAGLDTPVGEGGHGLSRGQGQRVALARAFLKDAPLLLLDEPTANLDPVSEGRILDGLRALSRNRTVLLLTHRTAPMKIADRIVVLAEGRVLEQGSYGQLMAAGARFRRLVERNDA